MEIVNPSSLQIKYKGSVKNVFASTQKPDNLWFSFTDQYSVFDWGQMPDLIANKGNALAIIGAFIFQKLANKSFWQQLPQSSYLKKFDSAYLQDRFNHNVFNGANGLQNKGLASHFVALLKGTPKAESWQKLEPLSVPDNLKNINSTDHLLMQVKGAQVDWPVSKPILHENIYFYPPLAKEQTRRLIPLEVVFRFGIVEGSSLINKLKSNPNYYTNLGLKSSPKTNKWLPNPVLEFFTKLEPKDRPLTWQEAAILANLSPEQFEQLVELSLTTALGLHALFAEHKLELWDGKLEFVFESSGQLLLADSVGPDELRLLHKGVQLSKEMLRLYYRHSTWYKSLAQAQSIANQNGQENWQEICQQQLKQSPQTLAPDIKIVADQLYGVLANTLLDYPVFSSHPNLEDFTTSIKNTFQSYSKEPINA